MKYVPEKWYCEAELLKCNGDLITNLALCRNPSCQIEVLEYEFVHYIVNGI